METPRDLDKFLQNILKPQKKGALTDDDTSFLQKMITAVDNGAIGLFIIVEKDTSLSYLVGNATFETGIEVAARWIGRTAKRLDREKDQ